MNGNVGVGTWVPAALFTVGKNLFQVTAGGVTNIGNINGQNGINIYTGSPNDIQTNNWGDELKLQTYTGAGIADSNQLY